MTLNLGHEVEMDWLKRWALYSPLRTALVSGETGAELNYRELFAQSLRIARFLREQYGVVRGDRVAVLAQNELESISLFFAIQRLGAILVPVNFRFTASEVQHIVNDSGAKLVIHQDPFSEVTSSLAVSRLAFERLCEVARVGEAVDQGFAAAAEDPCMILYTSGTTGFPKGAVISYRMIFWNSINTGLRLNLTQNDSVLTFLPLFHTGGWNVLTTPCLHRGAKIVLLRKFNAELILDLCASQRVSVLFGVPTTLDLLRRSEQFAKADLSCVRYAIVGGEAMPLELIRAWLARGVPIRQGYGLTEFGPNVFSLNEEDAERKMGSIGFPNFYIEARVVDGQGRDVARGEVGELVLKGPVAMSGYWENPKATAETIRDGWLYTGDLVRQDSEGYFYVVGRKKEMFISGGENVYPAEVEKVLRLLPGLREAAVVSAPHPKWGETGRAFVSFDHGNIYSTDDLREHCLKRLAKFKVPSEFVVLPELPKTESGKIAKKLLR